MVKHLNIYCEIAGKSVARESVLLWEEKRAKHVLSLLGERRAARGASVDDMREALVDAKMRLGVAGLERRLGWRVSTARLISRVLSRMSQGERRVSSVRLRVGQGTAEQFAHWFNTESERAFSKPMIAAHPDHFVIGEDELGRQRVVETTGGSPFPTEFFVDYSDPSSIVTPASAEYPIQIAGIATDRDGVRIGGVRHQFRDLEQGFECWLSVEFPSHTPRYLIDQHEWHLACEFSNWVEFQLAERNH